jgi:hypothetical protein
MAIFAVAMDDGEEGEESILASAARSIASLPPLLSEIRINMIA